jgi:(S)-ureidoglycine aminohydrolase
MKNLFLACCLLIPFTGGSQPISGEDLPPIPYIKYSWKTPTEKEGKNNLSTVIFEGAGHDMEYLQMSACLISPSKRETALRVPANEEYLIIVKSTPLTISFRDSTWTLTPGSIALLLPEEKFAIHNRTKEPGRYYLMKYRSKAPVDLRRGEASGGSFVKDWNKLPLNKHDRGGVRRYFEKPTAMCKRFEMHVTTLNEGLKSHDPHTHRAEEIVLMLEDTEGSNGKTEMQIGEQFFSGEAGDMYYLGSNVLHGVRNEGDTPCSYFAYQFE